jgi:hypothetical protein
MPVFNFDLDHRPQPQPGLLNEDGVQPDLPPTAYQAGDVNIIVLGDSFAYGWKVKQASAFPFLAGRILQSQFPQRIIRVADFGWVSSSPVLQLRQLREIGGKYKPALVIQALDMTDFSDDIRYTRQLRDPILRVYRRFSFFKAWFNRLADNDAFRNWLNRLITQPPLPKDMNDCGESHSRYYALEQPLAQSEPCLQVTWNAIQAAAQWAADAGARYALFILPRFQQYHPTECPHDAWESREFPSSRAYLFEPFAYFEAKKKSAPFPIHSLLPDFQQSNVYPTVFDDDPHYNENGHRIAGEAIARYLLADGLIEAQRRSR